MPNCVSLARVNAVLDGDPDRAAEGPPGGMRRVRPRLGDLGIHLQQLAGQLIDQGIGHVVQGGK